MNNKPSEGAPGKPAAPRSSVSKALLGTAAVLAVAAVAWLLLTATGVTDGKTAITIVAWVLVPVAIAVDLWTRSRRRRNAQPASLDDARRRIDTVALRVMKEQKGEVRAVKEARRQVPGLSLADATQLVRGL
ncbi:hypothetical protein [Streptomyces winkii]|uniref:hypothetical protein n=1 Tax=Streptomyces winkii TaxID=3051178 RepID=UPI0028CFE6E6|nr:hypothetical protein [Streptomyces sp. DSM 40971]